MKQFPIKKTLGALLAAGFLSGSFAYAAPSISIKTTAPKGSAGELPIKYIKGAAWTPCITAPIGAGLGYSYLNKNLGLPNTRDALQFDLNIKNEGILPADTKAGKMAYDTYFFFVNSSSTYIYNLQQSFPDGQYLYEVPAEYLAIGEVSPLRAARDFMSNDKKITVFGSPVRVDVDINQGLWSAVAVLIQAGADIGDFTKWEAFAVQPIVLGSPVPYGERCEFDPFLDTLAPTLESSIDDVTTVAIGANITLTFSEAVALGTGNIVLTKTTGTEVIETFNVATGQGDKGGTVTVDDATVTINPNASLVAGTDYYLTVASTAVKDLSDNFYLGIADATTLNFKTAAAVADDLDPTLTSSVPADGATDVAIGANIALTFSETVKAGTGDILIKDSSDDSTVATITVTDTDQVTFASELVTINPTDDLAAGTSYYVVIPDTAILDAADNAYAGISLATDLNFSTAAVADDTDPTLASSVPADGATDVAIGANIALTFSETVKAGTGDILIKDSSDDSTVATITVTDTDQVTFASELVTINPTADLAVGTSYYVVIPSTAILDEADNAYAGISFATDLNFSTVAE